MILVGFSQVNENTVVKKNDILIALLLLLPFLAARVNASMWSEDFVTCLCPLLIKTLIMFLMKKWRKVRGLLLKLNQIKHEWMWVALISSKIFTRVVHTHQGGINLSTTPCQAKQEVHQICTPAEDN